jgi:hypothetical protein
MWIETDHHGMVNMDYVKRVDLAGDIEKKTFGIYLFDVDGNTYPIVDIPRFKNIGIFQGNETEHDMHVAIYTFYTITKRLIGSAREREVITIEAIYKEFAADWYAQQKKELAKSEQKNKARKQKTSPEEAALTADETANASGKIHDFSDMKQFLDAYSEVYFTKFNKKPSIRYENEGKIARELGKMYPLDKLKTMLAWYFDSEEDFITRAQYDMKTFKAILERTQKVGGSN